jgi:hypothetical protein
MPNGCFLVTFDCSVFVEGCLDLPTSCMEIDPFFGFVVLVQIGRGIDNLRVYVVAQSLKVVDSSLDLLRVDVSVDHLFVVVRRELPLVRFRAEILFPPRRQKSRQVRNSMCLRG